VFNACFIPTYILLPSGDTNLTLEQIDKLFNGDKILLKWKPSMGRAGSPGSNVDEKVKENEVGDVRHIEDRDV
jgi:hypothetical protein